MTSITTPNKNMWHIIIGGTIGNLTEWYNFLLYGYLAPVISKEFFPSDNELVSLTLTYSVFAISFLVRPLGGILFGWIGDNYGRQRALVISLILIGIPTFLIACLPTYHTIGIASPILLCLLRVLQGLSAGGEHTGSAIYVAEHAPPSRRTLWVATVPTSAALGILISSTMALIIVSNVSPEHLLTWGWRLAYWIGTILCIISIILRVGLPETPDFLRTHAVKSERQSPISSLFSHKNSIKSFALVFGLAGTWGILYQILFIWMPTYLTKIQHLSQTTALKINSSFLLLFACLLILVGNYGDSISRKHLISLSSALLFIFALPIFWMLSSGIQWQIYLALLIFVLLFSIFIPTVFVIMIESFDVLLRYTGLSFGFNLGLAIFGGTCPLIVTWLIEITGNKISPAFYMMFAAAVAFVLSFFVQDKRGKNI